MEEQPKEFYDAAKLNEILAKRLASNDRSTFVMQMWAKFFSIIISSLVTIYSVITSSLFYYFAQLTILSDYILLIVVFGSAFTLPFIVISNASMPVELRISKKVISKEKQKGEYLIQYAYKPIYNSSLAIKKTINELLSTVFAILFPIGMADIVIGAVSNDPQIGINSTGQVLTGILFLVISILFLIRSVQVEHRKVKKSKAEDTEMMKKIIEKVEEVPLKTEEILKPKETIIKFDENGSLRFS